MEKRDGWSGAAAAAPDNGTDGARAERDRVRLEFYATYDVMTGVRIAATLGGFFALMVFLIVYKSRSKSVKALNDPKIVELAEAAVAEEEAEEEERQLTAALEEARGARERARSELAPEPPAARRPRRASLAPPAARRLSSATCSSSGSEYLERRGSSVLCRLSPAPWAGARPPRPAPLASAGSAGPSLALDCELASVGADSVFAEDDAPSTDDEVDQFSTDSGGGDHTLVGDCTELASRPRPALRPSHSHSRETLF